MTIVRHPARAGASIAILLAAVLPAAAQAPPPGSTPPRELPPTVVYSVDPVRVQPTPAPSGQPPGQTRKPGSERVQPQGFSVVLVVADLQGTSSQDDVPPAARKALTDLKDFLPYKSYKLIDAAWLLGQGVTSTMTRLRGVEEQDYELRLTAHPTEASRVYVRFTLNDADAMETPAAEALTSAEREQRAAALERERQTSAMRTDLARARQELERKRRASGTRESEELKRAQAEIANLEAELKARAQTVERRAVAVAGKRSPARAVIDTTFTMDVGETVVVGTSRLKGNGKALIALLTAVPPKGRM